MRFTKAELRAINKAAAKLWPKNPPMSWAAKVRELLRVGVSHALTWGYTPNNRRAQKAGKGPQKPVKRHELDKRGKR